jgi:hypothetical protein
LSLLLLAILVKLLFVLAALSVFGTSPDPISAIVREWQHWDANHYVYLSENGYATSGDARNLIAFFPLYPALIAALGVLGIAKPIGALVVSNLGGMFATLFLYELGRRDHDEGSGFRAAVLFNIFPTSYFLFAGYTEGLFCAFAFGAVLLARGGRWPSGAVLAGLDHLPHRLVAQHHRRARVLVPGHQVAAAQAARAHAHELAGAVRLGDVGQLGQPVVVEHDRAHGPIVRTVRAAGPRRRG